VVAATKKSLLFVIHDKIRLALSGTDFLFL
jgi:hypothetical protein